MKQTRKWQLTIASLAAVIAAPIVYRLSDTQRGEVDTQGASATSPAVIVARPERRPLSDTVVFTGEIQARNEVSVDSKVAGRVERVLVKVGQSVRARQLLAAIEHRELEWQSRQARAQVKVAEAALEQARINSENASTQRRRYEALRGENAVSLVEFEQIETASKSADTAVRAAASQVDLARAAAGLAGEVVRNSQITTPISGVIVKSLVDVGAMVGPGQTLFQVQDTSELKLVGAVGPEEFVRLRVGQSTLVTTDTIAGTEFEGKVLTLSPFLDPSTRRAAIEIRIEDKAGRLLPNMFARAEVETGHRGGVLSAPASAIVSLEKGKVIYVVRAGKALAVPLPTAAGEQEFVPVGASVSEADRIVVSGQETLLDGAPVRVVESIASKGNRSETR